MSLHRSSLRLGVKYRSGWNYGEDWSEGASRFSIMTSPVLGAHEGCDQHREYEDAAHAGQHEGAVLVLPVALETEGEEQESADAIEAGEPD